MALQHSPAQLTRRRADREDWERQVDELAQQLCSAQEWQQYFSKQADMKNKTAVLPVWRKYRGRAHRIAQLNRILPFTRSLPLKVNVILSEILLK